MLCFTKIHFLLVVMFYLRVCIIGGHVLQFEMSYLYEDRLNCRVCSIGSHVFIGYVLLEGMSNKRTGFIG